MIIRNNYRPICTCLVVIFLYLDAGGCTDPQGLITPTHLSSVPNVQDLQASVGRTSGGKRRVLLTWKYDTSSTNIRTWDIQRSVNDSTRTELNFFDLVRKPTFGFPSFTDSSGRLQNFTEDSLEMYYRVIPTGEIGNFIGEPSKIMHVLVRSSQ